MNANEQWLSIPKDIRKMLVENVFCSTCKDAVEIVNYIIVPNKFGIVLQGNCRTCNGPVARVVESEYLL